MANLSFLGSLQELVEDVINTISENSTLNGNNDGRRYAIKLNDVKPQKAKSMNNNKANKENQLDDKEMETPKIVKKSEGYQIAEEYSGLSISFNENNIREAFIYSEVFGKPKCKSRKRR